MASINFNPSPSNARPGEVQGVEAEARGVGLGDYVGRAIRLAQIDGDDDGAATYAGGFELGASVAGIAVRRLIEESDPSLLAGVVERVLGFSLPSETAEESARRAVLCGLLFEIGAVLEAAGDRLAFSGGDDEEIFGHGARNCRDAAVAARAEVRRNAATAEVLRFAAR